MWITWCISRSFHKMKGLRYVDKAGGKFLWIKVDMWIRKKETENFCAFCRKKANAPFFGEQGISDFSTYY